MDVAGEDAALIEEALAGPLAPGAAKVRAAILPSIRLERAAQATAGRLGPVARLARGTDWPHWRDRPLAHLAELDLAAMPRAAADLLPESGTLSFLLDVGEDQPWGFDPQDRGSGRVLFTPAGADRVDLGPAGDLMAYREGALDARVELTLPESDAPAAPELPQGEVLEAYHALIDALSERRGDPLHRLLGHPDQIQGEMQTEVQLVANGLYCGDETGYRDPRADHLRAGARGWRLLLQLDSEETEGIEVMWGDWGRIYFWIRSQDLQRGDFDAVWTILQCT